MKHEITDHLLTRVHDQCVGIINRVVLLELEEDQSVQQLKAGELAKMLAWQVLVLIITSIVGGIAVESLKEPILSDYTGQSAEVAARALVGKEVKALSDEDRNRVQAEIMLVLGPFEVSEDDVAQLTHEITSQFVMDDK